MKQVCHFARFTRGAIILAALTVSMLLLIASCVGKKTLPDSTGTPAGTEKARPDAPAGESAPSADKGITLAYYEEPVSISRNGTAVAPAFGIPLFAGDTVETGTNGTCEIAIPGIGSVTLTRDSRVRVDALMLEKRRAAISVVKGAAISKIEKLTMPDAFTVKSGSVVCGVRGTVFGVRTEPSGSCVLDVLEGTVSVFPATLVSAGLHPSSELEGIAPAETGVVDLPTVGAGETVTLGANSFAKADTAVGKTGPRDTNAIQKLVRDAMPKRGAIPATRRKALETARDREKTRNPGDSRGKTTDASGYSVTVMPIDAPIAYSGEGSFWQTTGPFTTAPASKEPAGTMAETDLIVFYNEAKKGASSVKIAKNRATLTVKKAAPEDWGTCGIERKASVSLKEGRLYAIEYTAWADAPGFEVSPGINEGEKDLDGDGVPYSLLSPYTPTLLSTEPRRYTRLYHHRGKDTSAARFTISAGRATGSAYIEDMTLTELPSAAAVRKPTTRQLVVNGDFSRGFDGWICQNQETKDVGCFSIVDGALTYRAKDVMRAGWHAQVGTGVSLVKGKAYRLSLDAAIEGEGRFGIDITEHDRDTNGDGNRFSPLAPWLRVDLAKGGWNRYQFDFKAMETDPLGIMQLNFGETKGTVRIMNLVLAEQP